MDDTCNTCPITIDCPVCRLQHLALLSHPPENTLLPSYSDMSALHGGFRTPLQLAHSTGASWEVEALGMVVPLFCTSQHRT